MCNCREKPRWCSSFDANHRSKAASPWARVFILRIFFWIFLIKNLKSGEARQIINETCQLYRWSSRDRLILDSCLAVSTSDPLCLNPSPAVHLINNLTQNRIRSHPTSIRHTLPLQQTPEFCSSDSSLSKGTLQLS